MSTTSSTTTMSSTTATTEFAVPGGMMPAAYADVLGNAVTGMGPRPGGEPGTLALAFPVDGSTHHVGAIVRQRAPDVVSVEISADGSVPDEVMLTATAQVRRVLSLDLDGPGFAEVARADHVLGTLWARFSGVRPVLFHSPYEAACWAVACQRHRAAVISRASRAARSRRRSRALGAESPPAP